MTNQEKNIKPIAFLIIVFAIPNILFLLTIGISKYMGLQEVNDIPVIIKKEAVLVVLDVHKIEKLQTITMQSFEAELVRVLKNSKAGELEKKVCDEKECTFAVLGFEADRLNTVIKPVLKTVPATSGYLKIVYDLTKSQEQVKKDLY